MARDPQLKIHLYGKDVKPGRKVGHVNTYGDDLDDCWSAPVTPPRFAGEGEWEQRD